MENSSSRQVVECLALYKSNGARWLALLVHWTTCALVSFDNDLYVLFRGKDGCKAKLDSVECHDVQNGKIWDLYGTIHA